jgi:glycosyltransferase involved in cell wall biosynthesis
MSQLDVLFVHNNFPAQFRNVAARLAANPQVRVAAIATETAPGLPGVALKRYGIGGISKSVHPFAARFNVECHRAEQVMYAANLLKRDGFDPDVVYVHPGWGEALPLRTLFPQAAIIDYAEFYYAPNGTDIGFDTEFESFGIDGEIKIGIKNAATLLSLMESDAAISPTHWQRSVFPHVIQDRIRVIHDGLRTDQLLPARHRGDLDLGGLRLAAGDEVVTFVSRDLEPYRGFHIFMRALPQVLKARPRARICLVGGYGVSYGSKPLFHESWQAAMLEEMAGRLDPARVHFLGRIAYDQYLALLRRSNAHVYLTYPFVLSWSMLEAMALECLLIASATRPVMEVVRNGETGMLVPFFDVDALADRIIDALANPARYEGLRRAARERIVGSYDFDTCCWPDHLQLLLDVGGVPVRRALGSG